jgi:hypothetical protein
MVVLIASGLSPVCLAALLQPQALDLDSVPGALRRVSESHRCGGAGAKQRRKRRAADRDGQPSSPQPSRDPECPSLQNLCGIYIPLSRAHRTAQFELRTLRPASDC